MAKYEVIGNPSFRDIEIGDTIAVRTGWGTGKVVHGKVVGKEESYMGDKNVVDYHVYGNDHDNWAYEYQIQKLIKES